MTRRYAETMFTPAVTAAQKRYRGRPLPARTTEEAPSHDELGAREQAFVRARDSVYIATVTETGWPYVQHRGGPAGFVRVLGTSRIGFADYRGNRQYISAGNLSGDTRVSLFLMDYPNKRRLKIVGHARLIEPDDAPDVVAQVSDREYGARVERAVIIDVVAFDWNCSQHITARYSDAEVQEQMTPMLEKIGALEQALREQHEAPHRLS